MNKFVAAILGAFLVSGCTKVSDYIATIIPALKEEPVQKSAPSLCPADHPTAQVIEGLCEGEWSLAYDGNSKVYTCSYVYRAIVTCPEGSVSIGQPSACHGQVDVHTKDTVSSKNNCKSKYKNEAAASYRLVCCT